MTSNFPDRSSWPWKVFLSARCALFIVPWLVHLLAADVVLSALLPVSALLPNVCYNISSAIAESVWRGIQFIFERINRADIIVSGAEKLPHGESAIVISNHVEWTDFYMIQALAVRSHMLGRCRWFAKQQLKWVPFLGWGLWAMGMPLVSRKWMLDQKEMDRVFKGVLQRHWPMWLIAYSEATRYTPEKRLEAEAWCKEHAKRLGQHLLYPRTKGFVACVQQLRAGPHVKAVYDVTVAYAKIDNGGGINASNAIFQSPPVFGQTILMPRLDKEWQFYVHVDRHPLDELPRTDEELAQWIEDRWVEKGERLEELNRRLRRGLPWDESLS